MEMGIEEACVEEASRSRKERPRSYDPLCIVRLDTSRQQLAEFITAS